MCKTEDLVQPDLSKLIAILDGADKHNAPEKLKQLRDATEGCPNCILAAIIQSGCQRPVVMGPVDWQTGACDVEDEGFWFPFDYKEERKIFWEEHNDSKREDYYF